MRKSFSRPTERLTDFVVAASSYVARILTFMAKQSTMRDILSFRANAAQCPSCFTFNHPEYLPDKKKQVQTTGLLLTCAVCGTPYESPVSKVA